MNPECFSMNSEEDQKIITELNEYAQYEGSEVGEACNIIVHLANYPDYVSDSFYKD